MTLCPRYALALTLALCLVGPTAATAEGVRSKLDKALRAAHLEGRVDGASGKSGKVHRVIIRTKSGARAAIKRTLERHGDVIHAEHASLDALTVLLHGEDLARLDADPSVLSISVDAEVRSFGAAATTTTAASLRETLDPATTRYSGAGIKVAIIDSGIEPVKGLADNIAGFWDFTRGGVAARPKDDYGHGTHLAGLIAGSGSQFHQQVAGLAPSARLYGFKVLDKNGRGRASDVIKALEFIVSNKKSSASTALRIDVVNLSLGHPIYEPAATDPLVRAVESAVRAGIVVVTAAGNFGKNAKGAAGYAGVTSPGNAPSAITVGAVDTRNTAAIADDRVASFSSRGPTWFDASVKPDFLAAGVALTSDRAPAASLFLAYPQLQKLTPTVPGSYGTLSGTSMAAAVATGAAAIVLQASRSVNGGAGLSPNALKAVLQYTALSLKDSAGRRYDALTQGTGELNPQGAVALALAIDTGMPVSAPWLHATPSPYTRIAGVSLPWSRTLLWDDRLVRTTDALSYNSPQWSSKIVWGTLPTRTNKISWGTAAQHDNIVWGTVSTWTSRPAWNDRVVGLTDGDNIVWGTVAGLTADNIVWGTWSGDNIVWGTFRTASNIVWGTATVDNIVWGTAKRRKAVGSTLPAVR